MSTETVPSSHPRHGGRRRWVYLAWVLVVAALLALLIVGWAAITVAGEARPAHNVLDAQFTTISVTAAAPPARDSYELWSDPVSGRLRLALRGTAQTLYYRRDAVGAWYVSGQRTPSGAWREVRLARQQQPALLTEQGLRQFFVRLRRQAKPGTVTQVALRGRVVNVFTSDGVTWPFPALGPTTVWLDAATGLPLQFRAIIASGAGAGTTTGAYTTTVDRLRTISSMALPYNFLTPPTPHPSPWERLLQLMRHWMRHGAAV